ncbi:MAG: arylesterase [Hyphomicrobiaceae bacterium]
MSRIASRQAGNLMSRADRPEVGLAAASFKTGSGPTGILPILSGFLVAVFAALAVLAPPAAMAANPLRLVVVGDSLTAGLGVPAAQAFPAQLEARLKSEGRAVEVINAGVSGDTTAAGLERLDWAVPAETDAVIVELGANDALRGIDPAETRRNLDSIVGRLAARGLPVLVAGMRAPANWGPGYQTRFDRIFTEVASRHNALLMPFFLDGVAMQPTLNQSDGIHPNVRGVARIVEAILPLARQLVDRAAERRQAAGKG